MNAVAVRQKAPTNTVARRELDRGAIKNLVDELKETQRRPRKKVPVKPPVPKQLKSPSLFTSQYNDIINALEGMCWLAASFLELHCPDYSQQIICSARSGFILEGEQYHFNPERGVSLRERFLTNLLSYGVGG
jgi:hypothetical protein